MKLIDTLFLSFLIVKKAVTVGFIQYSRSFPVGQTFFFHT